MIVCWALEGGFRGMVLSDCFLATVGSFFRTNRLHVVDWFFKKLLALS